MKKCVVEYTSAGNIDFTVFPTFFCCPEFVLFFENS